MIATQVNELRPVFDTFLPFMTGTVALSLGRCRGTEHHPWQNPPPVDTGTLGFPFTSRENVFPITYQPRPANYTWQQSARRLLQQDSAQPKPRPGDNKNEKRTAKDSSFNELTVTEATDAIKYLVLLPDKVIWSSILNKLQCSSLTSCWALSFTPEQQSLISGTGLDYGFKT